MTLKDEQKHGTNDDFILGWRAGLSERLFQVVKLLGSNAKAGAAAGLSGSHFARVMSGEHRIYAENLVRLAKVADVDSHWLITGEGEMRPSFDHNLMQSVLVAMVSAAGADGIQYTSPEAFADVALALHDYAAADLNRPLDALGPLIKTLVRKP